jgi:hypothetical protein
MSVNVTVGGDVVGDVVTGFTVNVKIAVALLPAESLTGNVKV